MTLWTQGSHAQGRAKTRPRGEGNMSFHGLLDSGLLYQKFHEIEHEGMRLGRNMWLDARSLAHMIENWIEEMNHPVRTTSWDRVLDILDQGKLGSCTGNAGTGAL